MERSAVRKKYRPCRVSGCTAGGWALSAGMRNAAATAAADDDDGGRTVVEADSRY